MRQMYRLLMLVALLVSAYTAPDVARFIVRDEHGAYLGLTDFAKNLIKNSRDSMRKRKELFDGHFKGFDSIFHAAHVNRLIKGNMFLYGPPGGAKSKFVRWMLDHEENRAFELQLHQMMTEQAFIGGQNFNAAKEGRFEINTQGSLAGFEVAYIDEFDKGNPAVLAALLSLLNERKVLAGNKVIESKLQTIFSTSNANIYEFYQQFIENGLRSTAPALLNRFTTISFVPNWLAVSDQEELDQNYSDGLDTFFYSHVQSTSYEKGSLVLDWDSLRELALCLFKPTKDFYRASRGLLNTLRANTIKEIEQNESLTQGLPYIPTVEYTERLRQRVHEIILMSVLIDFLQSDLVNDIASLEQSLKVAIDNRFAIGPSSLWRAHNALTTVTLGNVYLQKPDENGSFNLCFNDEQSLSTYQAKDKREESTIHAILEEQRRFRDAFSIYAHGYEEDPAKIDNQVRYEHFENIERHLLKINK